MPNPRTVSDFLMECLSFESTLECEQVLIVRKHKDGAISYDSNTNSNHDSYSLASLCAVYAQSDILKGVIMKED